MRLLDLTNRNRLLNFKFSGLSRRQVRLIDDLPDELMGRLEVGKRLAFKSLPELGDEPKDEKDDKFILALEQAKRSNEEYLAALDKLGDDEDGEGTRQVERALRDRLRRALGMPDRLLRDMISRVEWARRNGIEPSFDLPIPDPKRKPKETYVDRHIQTLLLPDELESALSAIYDQTRTALQETGVNTLYLALGYLEWYEAPSSQMPMYAPLLLHPVDIERKIVGGKYRYSIGSLGEGTEINITLSERLHKDFHRRLPVLDEDDKPEAYFRKVQAAIKDVPRWRVRRFAVAGHFAFARLVMFHDLEDAGWPGGRGVIVNPVIAKLFASHGTAAEAFFAEEYAVDEPAIAAKVPLLITDADSSQFSAIVDIMEGKNLAVRGPPGTGKSQTITNIVAAALAGGKTVLFAAAKMAALNVVKDRIEKAGLGHFCLELHSTKARKKDLLESLDKRMAKQGRLHKDGDLPAALKELERTRNQLSKYAAAINQPFGALDKTIHAILWAEQRTRVGKHALPKALDEIVLSEAKTITRHDVVALKGTLEVAARAYGDAAGTTDGLECNPWFGVGDAALDYFAREHLVEDMKRLRDALAALGEALDALSADIGAPLPEGIGEALGIADALARLPKSAPGIDAGLYSTLEAPAAFDALQAFEAQQAKWLVASGQIAEAAVDPEAVAHRSTELQALALLAKETELVTTSLSGLASESTALEAEAKRIGRTIGLGRRLAEAFGIETDMTVGALRKLLKGAQLAAKVSPGLRALRHPGLFDEAAGTLLAEAWGRAQALERKMAPLAERLIFGLDGEAREWHAHAHALRAADLFSALWRGEVRAAKRRYKGLMRVASRAKRLAMAADFEALAECVELARRLAADAELQAVCGPHFRGHETPFARLMVVNDFAVDVKRSFAPADKIDVHLRQTLLLGPSETLARIADFAEDPDTALAADVLGTIEDGRIDLDDRHNALSTRARNAAELGRRALALGLKPEIRSGAIGGIADAAAVRLNAEAAIEVNDKARELLGTAWHGPATERSRVVNALEAAIGVEKARLPPLVRHHLYHPDRDARIAGLTALLGPHTEALKGVANGWSQAKKRGRIDEAVFFGSMLGEMTWRAVAARVDRALNAPDQLAIWTGWLLARQECVENGLGGILDAFRGQPLDALRLSAAFDRVVYRTLARAALAEHPAVDRFRGLQLEKARARFRRLDEEIIQLQRKALAGELCRRPIAEGFRGDLRKDDTDLVLVRHELGKQKRHIPIRELLDRAGRAIQQLKPCFMMSPLSIAQFLKPSGLRFDLVVIDEASQMRPEEALGAGARGGQLVVVGDPMQLPPTSFFDRVDRAPDDEIDEQEIVDNESILDLALAEFRPARELRWHYRSRHESLIAFSNRKFYDDGLIVFPSPLDPDRENREPKLGVYHHFVPGKYKGHVNITEAQAVAEAAVAFMAAQPDKSLGIATLNQAQREVLLEEIERLVPRERSAQGYVERWEGTLEPFFVKNLENVQGDERDVIFISTVYGPDPATNVVMNRFGPINGIHGHRRLNVLFTRAKNRVEVFTSMRPSDIRAGEGSQPGMHALKAYLEYAETGKLEQGELSDREPDSEFEEFVRDRLGGTGFVVVPQVGVAGYFIDLAVEHPKRSGYLLGIECDGATYHSSRSARDRDRLRQEVLERLQWNIYRVWSTDWFHNPDEELRRLLAHMNGLLREEN
ncbi:MAG: DUF4011 domain-containing protein [Pseudomonadota bacterium]